MRVTNQRLAIFDAAYGHPDHFTAEDLLERAREIAERIAANGPLAVRNIKASVLAADALPEQDAYARELELGMEVMGSQDAKEGPKAFLEKRRPDFTGT